MERGSDFLLAIKETTSTEFDKDAADFLDGLQKTIAEGLTRAGAVGERRDRMLFFEGMLRGVQVKLAKVRLEAASQLHDRGLSPKTPPSGWN